MKKLILAMLLAMGCSSVDMRATQVEKLAANGLQARLGEVDRAVATITTDERTATNIFLVGMALVELDRADRSLSEAAAKSRGLDVALVLSGSEWIKR